MRKLNLRESVRHVSLHKKSAAGSQCCLQYTILPAFLFPLCIWHSARCYRNTPQAFSVQDQRCWHTSMRGTSHTTQLALKCTRRSYLYLVTLQPPLLPSLPPGFSPMFNLSLTLAVASLHWCQGLPLLPGRPFSNSSLPDAGPDASPSRASASRHSPFRHARPPWQPPPLHLPCWACHTHPWEDLQVYPEQNTEAWARRRTGSRAPENTGQVPSWKEKW